MKKLSLIFVFMMFFAIGIASNQAIINPKIALAADPQLESVVDNINNSQSVLGSETKTKVAGISKDVQEVILIVVIATLMVTGSLTAIKFANVGDNSSEKAKLKTTLIFLVGGIVFLASFYGLMRFGFKYFNLFG